MIGTLWRRLKLLLVRDRATRELEEEMELHRQLRSETLERQGHSNPVMEAERRFGNSVRIAEESRDKWGFGTADAFWQDIRHAARRLRQRPGFTASVVGILALGIGATTAMFSAVDAAMLRPLPFLRPNELVTLNRINIPFNPGGGREDREQSFDITHRWQCAMSSRAWPRMPLVGSTLRTRTVHDASLRVWCPGTSSRQSGCAPHAAARLPRPTVMPTLRRWSCCPGRSGRVISAAATSSERRSR